MTTDLEQPMSRRALIVGSTFAVGAGAAYAATPRMKERRLGKNRLGDLVPPQIGAWHSVNRDGIVVAQDEESAPVDGYDQVLTRTYDASGRPTIMLLLAYGSTQGGSLQLHRPETCYPGQGFALRSFDETRLDLGDRTDIAARRFTAMRDDRVERVVYWTRVAQQFPLSTTELYVAILSAVIRGVVPDGFLVRFSTIETDNAIADAAIDQFAAQMLASVSPRGRELLVGRSSTPR